MISEGLDLEIVYETIRYVRQSLVHPAEVDILIIDLTSYNNNSLTNYGEFLSILWYELNLPKVTIHPVLSDYTVLPYVSVFNPFVENIQYKHSCSKYYCSDDIALTNCYEYKY